MPEYIVRLSYEARDILADNSYEAVRAAKAKLGMRPFTAAEDNMDEIFLETAVTRDADGTVYPAPPRGAW